MKLTKRQRERIEAQGYRPDDISRLLDLARRVDKARNFPINTCGSSRHLHIIADNLIRRGEDYMLTEEPTHCAESILGVLASLWEARTELAAYKAAEDRKPLGGSNEATAAEHRRDE